MRISGRNQNKIEPKLCILKKGLPFEVKLPGHPLDISRMTAAQPGAELEKGYADMQAGYTVPAKQVFVEIRREYGI